MSVATDQRQNLRRVTDKIAPVITAFFTRHRGELFRAKDLLTYVKAVHPEIAPDSPSRIMRQLRQAGEIDYQLVSRADSRYLALSVRLA